MNRDETLAKLRDRLAPIPDGVVAVYLFGSVARGQARASSDVDIGVLYEVAPPATLEGLGFELAYDLELAIRRPVDLVVLNRAPADLIHRVLRDGVLVVERDRARRIEFEIQAPDADLVTKKLALIETYVRELRELADPTVIASDVRERRFVEHTLQIAIQAMLDVASHIVSDERVGEPENNGQLFELLAQGHWVSATQRKVFVAMVSFRNILVHGYATVDPTIVRNVVENHLDDLTDFVVAIRGRLSSP
jgi:uncharacterized protein YutE (UPF0331/DUF86 family)/predicted nucleotidyltransferase